MESTPTCLPSLPALHGPSTTTGTGPQQGVKGKHSVLLEDLKHEGSMEATELGALPHASTSLDGENRGGRTRDPIVLPLPGPLFMEGLADAALEDGECLVGPSSGPQPPSSMTSVNWKLSAPSTYLKILPGCAEAR